MQVYMLKDVERIGMAGQILNVSDGHAMNFLIPRKLAVEVTAKNAEFYQQKKQKEQVSAAVVSSKLGMMAERIKSLHLNLKERVHDDGKLYGSVGADEIVQLLKEKDINVNKKQIEFDKSIKSVGEHKVTIKLNAKLKPQLTLKVEGSKEKTH
jgi:large subunit ribosomal protein L9